MALGEIMKLPRDETILLGGDLNGHVGERMEEYEGIHGGFGFGQRNAEGVRILEFCDALRLVLCNTCFKKEKNKLVTYSSGGSRSVIDYIAVKSSDRKMITNVKVLPSDCLLYTSPSPRDLSTSRMPSSA